MGTGMPVVDVDVDIELDTIPRYVPDKVTTVYKRDAVVIGSRTYPPNQHPDKCPLIHTRTAVEVITAHGSRWYGVERAWINSELRMVVSGFNRRFEEMSNWEVCKRI